MTERTADLRASLTVMSEGFRKLNASPGAWMMAEFVLRAGIDCTAQALPSIYRRRMPKQCFANTAALVRRAKGLTYVEGFTMCPRVPFPVHHAWAINVDNEVIDLTLSDPELCSYCGVTFTRGEYEAATRTGRGGKSASALLDWVGCIRADMMTTRCPDLIGLMP